MDRGATNARRIPQASPGPRDVPFVRKLMRVVRKLMRAMRAI
jgi:hypothetical protein